MLCYPAMLVQAELLLIQRVQLTSNRYCTYKQLCQHDEKLFTTISWLRQQSTQAQLLQAQPWLRWLLNIDDRALLPFDTVSDVAHSIETWLLLHQLKQCLFSVETTCWYTELTQCLASAAEQRYWTLAYYLKLNIKPLDLMSVLTPAALWYLILTVPLEQLAQLEIKRQSEAEFSVLQALLLPTVLEQQSALAGFSPAVMLHSIKPHRFGLSLLMAATDDVQRTRFINYLANSDQQFAIEAMGLSGQLKFVPLLTELAQQQELQDVAADALALLLGTLQSERYLTQPEHFTEAKAKAPSSRYLCGAPIAEPQLAAVWQSGNCMQRQFASCLSRFWPGGHQVEAADRFQVAL